MKLLYGFLFLCLFAQTPEAEFLTASSYVSMAQYGHGSVEVTQGRRYIHVRVKSEGRFDVQLIRSSDRVQVDGGDGAIHHVFHFDQSSLAAGQYQVRVVFIDEALRAKTVLVEVKE